MDILTPNQLDRLIAASGEALLSIYLPTERAGRETRQNPIRLKNLVAEAERRLVEAGADPGRLDPLRTRVDDYDFWQHQGDGLAIFTDGDDQEELRLPAAFDELVVVGERFHVKPLLPALDTGRTFFVLALSENEVRLLQGTRYTVADVAADELPESLAAALWYEDPEKTLQHHATARGGSRAMLHGHGLGEDDDDDRRRRYLRVVDDAVRAVAGDSGAPLVLAATERNQAAYQAVTKYPDVFAQGIDGNPEDVGREDLHARAWEIVSSRFGAERAEAAARYRELAGTGATGTEPGEVALAAADGRVSTLFVAHGTHAWGRFDHAARVAEVHDQREPGDRDLADAAAAATYRTGGRVLVLPPDEMPAAGPLAAVYRY